jgi:hypothetical protein
MLAGVQVEHPADQCAFEPGAMAEHHMEAAAGKLHAALEIDDAQLRSQLPVRQRLKAKPGRGAGLALLANDRVLALVCTDRDALVRQVRHEIHRRLQILINLAQLLLQVLDALVDAAHLFDQRLALLLVLEPADLLRGDVALVAQVFQLLQDLPAAGIQLQDLVDGRVGLKRCHCLLNLIRMLANCADINHR